MIRTRHLPGMAGMAVFLASCTITPAYVRESDARLYATVSSPRDTYLFDCNPVRDALARGERLKISSEENSFHCASTDGKAELSLTLLEPSPRSTAAWVDVPGLPPRQEYRRVTTTPPSKILLALTLLNERPATRYEGEGTRTQGVKFNPFLKVSQSGQFKATLGGLYDVRGGYTFGWDSRNR